MLSIKAASSIINKDTASERAASALEDLACIFEPLINLNDNLLFSAESTLSHEG